MKIEIDIQKTLPKWARLAFGYLALYTGIMIMASLEIILVIANLITNSLTMDQALYEEILLIDYYSNYSGSEAVSDSGVGILLSLVSLICLSLVIYTLQSTGSSPWYLLPYVVRSVFWVLVLPFFIKAKGSTWQQAVTVFFTLLYMLFIVYHTYLIILCFIDMKFIETLAKEIEEKWNEEEKKKLKQQKRKNARESKIKKAEQKKQNNAPKVQQNFNINFINTHD